MKTIELKISDELAAKVAALGCEFTGEFRPPRNKAEPVWTGNHVSFRRGEDWPDDCLILRKLPEPWAPGVGEHKTRGGDRADIRFVSKAGKLVGESSYGDGVRVWEKDGSYLCASRPHHLDLVPPSEPAAVREEPLLEGWVNVYGHWTSEVRATERESDKAASPTRLRCVHVREVVEPAEQGGAGL